MDPTEYSTDANEALELSLYAPKTGTQIAHSFNPIFTYPLFGENETIFGYKDLNVKILFAADDMMPCVEVTYGEKIPKVGDVEAEDVGKVLGEFLPEGTFVCCC